jgi:hypothetical protein
MEMFGAFAYALSDGLQFTPVAAGFLALLPACGIEYLAVRPLWNLMFQFQGQPCSSIGTLLMCQAKAVTPFRNGRGLVAVEHDGRIVQLSARLVEAQAGTPIRVGDVLLIEEVNVATESVVVSVYYGSSV